MVGSGRNGCGLYLDRGLGGGTDGRIGGDGWEGNRDGQSRWKDNVAHTPLGKEPNISLSYAPGLELNHPIMSTLGKTKDQLDRDRDRHIELVGGYYILNLTSSWLVIIRLVTGIKTFSTYLMGRTAG